MANYVEGSWWYYVPNKGGPIAFCILFFLSGVFHGYQTWKYKSWRFTLAMPWSGLLMVAGFALREAGAHDYKNLPIMIASQALIVSGPPVYALTDYLILSRILFYIPYLAPLHPGRVLTTFLGLDAIIEALAVNGIIRLVNAGLDEKHRKIGESLLKVSLILQAACFVAFVVLAAHFHRKALKAGVLSKNIRSALILLYASSAIITIRCIYRIVEYFEGPTGTIYRSETYFYIFEAAFMFLNTLMLNVWHPGKYLPPNNHVFLAKDGKTEMRGPGWKDDRNFFLTLFDPFDLFGLAMGNDKKTRFWDMPPEELEAYCDAEEEKNKNKWYKKLQAKYSKKDTAAPAKKEQASTSVLATSTEKTGSDAV